MTKVKDLGKDDDKKAPSWSQWVSSKVSSLIGFGMSWGQGGYIFLRYAAWFTITTGMITLFPLLMELERESVIEELEKVQIAEAISQGVTPHELASQGLSAIEPSVLK